MRTTISTAILTAALAVAGFLAACLPASAQDLEAPILPRSVLGFERNGADDILAIDAAAFLRGWNWAEMDSISSSLLGVNLWHLHDPWTWQGDAEVGVMDSTNAAFDHHHQPNQLLIPDVQYVSFSTEPERESSYWSVSEAMAMEYQPWLEMASDTFTLRADDSTGGVFGFRDRSPLGSVVKDGTDGCYRYCLKTDDFTAPTQVLSSVEHNEALYRSGDYEEYSTDNLWLAINLRRNDIASSDSLQLDDVVLRIRVPLWLHSSCGDSSGFARFRFIPAATGTPDTITSTLNTVMGLRWPVDSVLTAPTEIVITRRMLPQWGLGERDITIYAGLVFDYQPTGTSTEHPWRNPRLNLDQNGTIAHFIDRLGLNVTFEDELGVDIKWVRLNTWAADSLFWGQRDAEIASHVDDLVQNMIAYDASRYAASTEQPRLFRFYGRDEIRLSHFKGFRYINRLLNDLLTTEWEIQEVNKARHCLRLREQWQGFGFRLHDQTYSPAFRHGYFSTDPIPLAERDDTLNRYCNLYRGRDDAGYSETRLHIFEGATACDSVGLNVTVSQLPIAPNLLDSYIRQYAEGVQPCVETYLYHHVLPNKSLLFDRTVPWISNVWLYSTGVAAVTPETRFRFFATGRPKSAEEMRLQHWLPLVLGAKGLVGFCGRGGVLPEPANWPAGTPSQNMALGAEYADAAALAAVTWTDDRRLDDDDLGPDYVQANEPGNLDNYITDGLAATALAMHNWNASPPGIYVGRKSARQTIREIYRTLDPYWETLRSLHLVGWRAQGYAKWFTGDTTNFDQWLRRDSAAQLVRVCNEPTPQVPWLPRQEAYDSTFFDLTLHQAGDTALADVAYVAVVNRRTDCLTKDEVNGRFRTYEQFFDHINDAQTGQPDSLYTQNGARRIRIPFHYDHTPVQAVNLHVQELREVDATQINQRPSIDTIIGMRTPLDVDFLPGEGKFFRVSTMPASSSGPNDGYLAHSNQRKMVAYPSITGWVALTDTVDYRTYYRQVVGDSMWYHRVYHRRRQDNSPANPNYLSVYYQRSIPYLSGDTAQSGSAYQFTASTVQWETEILLSDTIVVNPQTPFADTVELSCGYPAIVVRPDTLDPNYLLKAYVVYACESEPSEQVPHVLICEAVLPATASHTSQEDYLSANPSQALATAAINTTWTDTLFHWGTPMINASMSGNYYCWSDAQGGIGVGFKQPDRRQFTPGQRAFVHAHDSLLATHPSLNSYSRLHIGEDDAGLVWQEGLHPVDGTFILYTRLKHDQNMDIYYDLNAGTTRHVVGPGIISGVDPDILSLAEYYTELQLEDTNQVSAYHGFPVLFRQLSDWGLLPASPWYDLSLVNHKAERAYWQTELTTFYQQYNHQHMIGRRAFDIAEWSVNMGVADTLWSQAENYILGDSLDLLGPDVAQGEVWGEPFSDPPNASGFYADSTTVLEFWSDTSELWSAPTIWTMSFGWQPLYAQDHDHRHADLVASGLLKPVGEPGLYPHLAARYTTMAHRGFARNRRIFNGTGGVWPAYQDAPSIITSSQWFFRQGDERAVHGFVYCGLRGSSGDALLGPVWVESLQQWQPTKVIRTGAQGRAAEVATPWFTLQAVDDLSVMTRSWSDQDLVGTAYIERCSDGRRLNLYALAVNQDGATARYKHTVLSDPQEEYRVILTADNDEVWPAQDVEIAFDDNVVFGKGQERSILDLRSMETAAASTNSLMVYPNPAADVVKIVVDLRPADSTVRTATHPQHQDVVLRITTVDGREMVECSAQELDVLALDTSLWPAGVYIVNAIATSTAASSLLHVIHH